MKHLGFAAFFSAALAVGAAAGWFAAGVRSDGASPSQRGGDDGGVVATQNARPHKPVAKPKRKAPIHPLVVRRGRTDLLKPYGKAKYDYENETHHNHNCRADCNRGNRGCRPCVAGAQYGGSSVRWNFCRKEGR